MEKRRLFVRVSRRGCSHCRKKIDRMRDTHRGQDEHFHYRCPVCHSLWCRQVREYGTLEEFASWGVPVEELASSCPHEELVEVE